MTPTDVSAAELSALIDAALPVVRLFAGVAMRSLEAAGAEITLPQFRTLVVLVDEGPHAVGSLATRIGLDASTVTRMCDRLTRAGLLRRRRHTGDRRSVVVTATAAGHAVVDAVRRRRRADLAALLGGIPAGRRAQLVKALQALSPNALDDEDADWSIGWTT